MLDEQDWALFKRKLNARTEIDLDLYKEPQMKRRIGSLVQRHGYDSYAQYFDSVQRDKKEFDAFIQYLTINVSEFFRTPEKFAKLETDVFPELLRRTSRLNIWSAGCSIGAEPYSLAMILKEMTPTRQHRILATDLDVDILAKAKRAIYSANEIKCVPPQRVRRYFTKIGDDEFALHEDIKRLIEFHRHNLLKDPFESGFDLILCRNVVIYFTEEAKFELYKEFYRALKPGGVLFVGATEAILNFRKIGYVNYQPFFYQRPLA